MSISWAFGLEFFAFEVPKFLCHIHAIFIVWIVQSATWVVYISLCLALIVQKFMSSNLVIVGYSYPPHRGVGHHFLMFSIPMGASMMDYRRLLIISSCNLIQIMVPFKTRASWGPCFVQHVTLLINIKKNNCDSSYYNKRFQPKM